MASEFDKAMAEFNQQIIEQDKIWEQQVAEFKKSRKKWDLLYKKSKKSLKHKKLLMLRGE